MKFNEWQRRINSNGKLNLREQRTVSLPNEYNMV